jgi:hypothetical protein
LWAQFNYAPKLSADLGYCAVYMGVTALKTSDPLVTLRRGMTIQGTEVVFDERRVAGEIPQEIFQTSASGESMTVRVASH